jgi:hypothetical protein
MTTLLKIQETVAHVKISREIGGNYMSFTEMLKQGLNEGKTEGITESLLNILKTQGTVDEQLKKRIKEIKDVNVLKDLLSQASKVGSIEQFTTYLNNLLEKKS